MTTHFEDYNETLLDEVLEIHPDVASLEMETFHLYASHAPPHAPPHRPHALFMQTHRTRTHARRFHLAHCSRGSITASAATIVLAQRRSGAFLDHATTRQLERDGGCAVLDALAEYPLPEGVRTIPAVCRACRVVGLMAVGAGCAQQETMSGDCVWNQ